MTIFDNKQSGFTMAVFSAPCVPEIVVFKNTIAECKAWVDDLMTEWIQRASGIEGGAVKQAMTFSLWYYRIAHEGKIVEEGSVADLPTKRA
jgi:hypothetical protein